MKKWRGAFRLILAELTKPSAQRDNWFLWATVQTAHIAIGVVLAGVLLFFLPPIWSFTVASLSYALLKEFPDYFRAPGWAGARDSVQDALFVTSGAAQAVAIDGAHNILFAGAVIAAIIGLLLGVTARLKRNP